MVCAVLFDLDDTLFDHQHGARCALEAVQRSHDGFARMAFAELSRLHAGFLEALHVEVMTGRRALDDARRERFRRLFESAGILAGAETIAGTALSYRDAYLAERRAIAGAAALLDSVRQRARVGIVTNNLRDEQQEKLRACGLDRYVDTLVVSETAGVAKPDPAIFAIALDALGCEPSAAVMVGDSWAADICGARAAGITPVWFNPSGAPAPDVEAVDDVRELRAWEPVDDALRVIFS